MNKLLVIPLFFVPSLHAGNVMARVGDMLVGEALASKTTFAYAINKAQLRYNVPQRTGSIVMLNEQYALTVEYSREWTISLFIQKVTVDDLQNRILVYRDYQPYNSFNALPYEIQELIKWLFDNLVEMI